MPSPLREDQIEILGRYGQRKEMEAGEVLFRAGDTTNDFLVVLEGEVEVAAVPDGLAAAYNEKYEMEVVSPGDELWRVRHRLAYAWREHDYPQSATRFDFP